MLVKCDCIDVSVLLSWMLVMFGMVCGGCGGSGLEGSLVDW